jgi:hypothetical protein
MFFLSSFVTFPYFPNKKRLSIWRQTKGSEQILFVQAVSIIIVVKSNCVHKNLKKNTGQTRQKAN